MKNRTRIELAMATVLVLAAESLSPAVGSTLYFDTNGATAGVDAVGANVPITITGGTLRLDNSSQIDDTATMALSGGTFNLNGKSETLGALSVTANSQLDFGSGGNSTLLFASASRTGGTLFVDDWDGGFIPGGGGNDKLEFATLPTGASLTAFLANIQFTASSFFPVGFLKGARAINDGAFFEIVPIIPEPATAMLLGLGALTLFRRRRGA